MNFYYKFFPRYIFSIFFLVFPSILYANFIDTKWTVTGYLGELWFAEEEEILGKQQEFFKGWSDGIFYSCNYGGQSATYNSYTIREFLDNREFFLVNQEKAFANVFADNGLTDKNTEVFVHRITCNGKTVNERKVMYPFVTVEGSNKGFYVYEGAIIIFEYDD